MPDTGLLEKLPSIGLAVVESAEIDGDGSLLVAVRPRKSQLMLVTARLKYIAESEWGSRRYLDVSMLKEVEA